MIRLIFSLFLIPIFIFASTIDKKIAQNQKSLDSSKENKDNTTVKIKEIADKIEASNTNLSKLEEDIIKINEDIEQHQKLLESSQSKLNNLQAKSSDLIKEKNSSEEEIINTIVEQFSTSLALQLASKESLQELIDNEMFNLLSTNAKQKVLKLNENYNRLTENTKANQQEINKLNSYIKDRLKTKENYKALQIKQYKAITIIYLHYS